jgi:SAM-dependent methyltransferase
LRSGAAALSEEWKLAFSSEWETAFRSKTHLSVWPWSDLVSYIHRHAAPATGFRRVLELGCGMGANIPFLLSLGIDYHAIEGSATAVSRLHDRFPELRRTIVTGDFTQLLPFEGLFDLVIDRAAIQHNATDAVRHTIGMVYGQLRAGGKLIGIDWLSSAHSEANGGTRIDDHTRRDIPSRAFEGLGVVHFFDERHLTGLLVAAGFHIERLEHKIHEIVIPAGGDRPAWWNFIAVKP